MQRKIFWLSSKIMNIVTIICTIIFTAINFDNLISYLDFICPINIDPSKTLSARFQYWFENVYGNEKEIEIRWKIQDFTIWIIEHHINLIFLR